MRERKQIMSGWGGRYSISQLTEALHNNRTEFLELCRQVVCDESDANNLISLVEKYLEDKKPKHIATSLDLGQQEPHVDPRSNMDEEVNLIQLLAEVHLISVTQGAAKR